MTLEIMSRIDPKEQLPRYYLQKDALTKQMNKRDAPNDGDRITMIFYKHQIERFRNEIENQPDGKKWLVQFDRNRINDETITERTEQLPDKQSV